MDFRPMVDEANRDCCQIKSPFDLSIFFNATPITEEAASSSRNPSKKLKDLNKSRDLFEDSGHKSPLSISRIMNRSSSESRDPISLPWLNSQGIAQSSDFNETDHYGDQSGKSDKEPLKAKLIGDQGLMINRASKKMVKEELSVPKLVKDELEDGAEAHRQRTGSVPTCPIFDMPSPQLDLKKPAVANEDPVQSQLRTSQELMKTIMGSFNREMLQNGQYQPDYGYPSPQQGFANPQLNYFVSHQQQNQYQHYGYQGPLSFQPLPSSRLHPHQQHQIPYQPNTSQGLQYIYSSDQQKMQAYPEQQSAYSQYCYPVSQAQASFKQCTNCGATSTPSWRRCPEGKDLLCNACGLYVKLHNRPRPVRMTEDGTIRVQRVSTSYEQPDSSLLCENCGMTDTSIWRRERGRVLCNTCLHYLKCSELQRPLTCSITGQNNISLPRDPIQDDTSFMASLVSTGELLTARKKRSSHPHS